MKTVLATVLTTVVVAHLVDAEAASAQGKLKLPPPGQLYHCVFAGKPVPDSEEQITELDVDSYVRQAGKNVALVYFDNDWATTPYFPWNVVGWINYRGAIPYIRLCLRSSLTVKCAGDDRVYALERIIHGHWDKELTSWAKDAKDYGHPLIVEFGTECNGSWFPWCGVFNGGGTLAGFGDPKIPDGPERFVRAYRHLIKLMRDDVGATNITWVFHVNYSDSPADSWNRFENYYPDNVQLYPKTDLNNVDYIDWLAVSCYGPQSPCDPNAPATFRVLMNGVCDRFLKMAPSKPVMVAEFGCSVGYFENNSAAKDFKADVWAAAALDDLLGAHRWKNVIGFSWWNCSWTNDRNPAHDTNMRLEGDYDLSQAFRGSLARYESSLAQSPVNTLHKAPTAVKERTVIHKRNR